MGICASDAGSHLYIFLQSRLFSGQNPYVIIIFSSILHLALASL